MISICPEYKESPEHNIQFAYLIYGGYYAYKECQQYDFDYTISVISSMTKFAAKK